MKRFRPVAVLAVVLLAAAAGMSCVSHPIRSDTQKASASPLESVLEPIRREHGLPALAAVVVDRAGVVAEGAVGVRRQGHSEAVTLDDAFHLGSCTKAITGTLAGLLVQEGSLHWEWTAAEAFPDLAMKFDPDYRPVTLRQLLSHRAGLPHTAPAAHTLMDMHRLKGTVRDQRIEYVTWLLSEKPGYPAGAKQEYSNAGYCVAAAMMEAATNRTWEALVQERIFGPLDMASAGFGPMGREGVYDQPRQHWKVGNDFVPVEPGPLKDNPPVMTPSGRVHCSVRDWAKFVRIHLLEESERPLRLDRETMTCLHTPAQGADYAPGGWMVVDRPWAGGRALYHGGSNTMNFANVWVAPNKGFAILVMTNAGEFPPCDKVTGELIRRYEAGEFSGSE